MKPGVWIDPLELLHLATQINNLALVEHRKRMMRERRQHEQEQGKACNTQNFDVHRDLLGSQG